MLEIRKLSAGYSGAPVLEDISLAMPEGTITVIAGPNGCGKSTLLKALTGILPVSGTVLLDGTSLLEISHRELAKKIAFLPQNRQIPEIAVKNLVLHGRFPYLSYPRRYRPEDYTAADRALAQMDALEIADRSVVQLSGGQRQKVYLAMALAQDTNTILMDEPTTYLDIRHQMEVMHLARKLAERGKAVVLVLHDLCLAMETADELVVLSEGTVQQTGTPEEIYASGVLERVMGVVLRRIEADGRRRYVCELPLLKGE